MMESRELKQEIRRLLDQHNAILLAHNYQRDEIQEIADITGDSLALSIAAAETDRNVIVFCGVHFMAESAAILAPEKVVLLPRSDAGCPMADMVTPEGLREMKGKYPGAVVVTYVNSSAAVKAESDICCTSSNAINVVNSLEASEVILVPDQNLGNYIAKYTDKICHLWEGYCPTHERLTVEDVERAKQENPDGLFIAHPECPPEILDLADHICSTSGMYSYARENPSKKFIIGTEMGILYRLRKENPEKEFILPTSKLICPNMKLTSLEDVLSCLQTMSPEISVPSDVRKKAKRTLDRMLAVPRD
jgi:quinolinate synthase